MFTLLYSAKKFTTCIIPRVGISLPGLLALRLVAAYSIIPLSKVCGPSTLYVGAIEVSSTFDPKRFTLSLATCWKRYYVSRRDLDFSFCAHLHCFCLVLLVKYGEGRIGYVLASHYSEVYRGSAINLQSLQCWASSLPVKIRVVE